jgi:hypothetical protein
MMTRDLLREEMAISEANEEQTYKTLTLALFRDIQEPLKQLYDQTVSATINFTSITPDAIKASPKTIKTLRYCLAPVISQMRLGQLIGLDTTEGFEEQGLVPNDEQADRLARWFNDYLDKERFQWLARPKMSRAERAIAETYAKLWTVSLQSNQNTATKYRTQRKEQEKAIAAALEGMGLKLQEKLGAPQARRPRRKSGDPPAPPLPRRPGGIDTVDDIRPGHYVKEKKILGGSQKKQKSDLTARPSTDAMLYCVEAKAVGIKLDSTKRLKELNDKYTDWMGSSLPITTVGVVAGMFSDAELVATIKQRQIPIFFEHDLGKLVELLKSGQYYGAPWNPADLFKDVTVTELENALEKIQTAPVDDESDAEQQKMSDRP